MSEFPPDWTIVPIREIITESRISPEVDDPSKRISVRLHCEGVEKRSERATDQAGATRYYKRLQGQFIYGKQNLHKGAVGIVPKELHGFCSSQDIPAFDINDSIDPNWLLHLFRQRNFYESLESIASGTGSKRIQPQQLGEKEIAVPPLPEQKKIAEILSGIDSCIALMEIQKKKNEQTLETISAEVFGRLTASDPVKQLSEVCALITKGATPTTFGHKLLGTAFQGSVTFLGGGSTSETGKFDLHPARHCTQDAVVTLKRSQLAEGDTLVTIVGASIGNTCQIPGSILPANINQNVALARSDEAALDKNFLNLFLRTEGRRMLVHIATTQAQPSVSLAQVGQLQIPIPNLDEQRRIVSAVEGIRESISQIDEKICKSKHLKEALSGDLLSGRKRVSV